MIPVVRRPLSIALTVVVAALGSALTVAALALMVNALTPPPGPIVTLPAPVPPEQPGVEVVVGLFRVGVVDPTGRPATVWLAEVDDGHGNTRFIPCRAGVVPEN